MNKIKLRFQIVHYQPIYTGAGKSLEKLIKALDKNIFEIEILTTYKLGLQYLEYIDGYKIIRISGKFFGSNGYLTKWGRFYFAMNALRYNLFNNNFNIINFIGVGTVALPSILVARILNKKIVNKITAVGDDDPKKLSKTILGKYILKLLEINTVHWVISREIYDNCIEHTKWEKRNIFLITNPVQLIYKKYHELLTQRNKYTTKKNIFLFVGVLNRRKGVDILLNLWLNSNIDSKLILCGPRGNDNHINEMLDNLNKNNIKELGSLDYEDLKKQYLMADYFIFPSKREGLPNVVLEAMSFGLPVIANEIKGVTDFLLGSKNERGLLVQNNDFIIWQTIIKNIENSTSDFVYQTISKNAYDWIVKNSESSVVAKKMKQLYLKDI